MNKLVLVQKTLSEIMEVSIEQISMDSRMEDFELWDSLSHLRLVMEIEHQFKVEFSIDEIITMNSVQRILDLLDAKCGS